MEKEITLTPGYDPDKFRDELCEIFIQEKGSRSLNEYMMEVNENVRKLFPNKEFVTVGTKLKMEN